MLFVFFDGKFLYFCIFCDGVFGGRGGGLLEVGLFCFVGRLIYFLEEGFFEGNIFVFLEGRFLYLLILEGVCFGGKVGVGVGVFMEIEKVSFRIIYYV